MKDKYFQPDLDDMYYKEGYVDLTFDNKERAEKYIQDTFGIEEGVSTGQLMLNELDLIRVRNALYVLCNIEFRKEQP